LDSETAFIYRRGLSKDDLFRETFTFNLATSEGNGHVDNSIQCLSLPAMLAYHKDADTENCSSDLQSVANLLKKGHSKLFASMFADNELKFQGRFGAVHTGIHKCYEYARIS
jgi:hypothetical protein